VEFDKWFGRGLTTIASFPRHTHHNPCFRDYGDRVATHSTGTVTPKQTRTLTTSSTRNVKGGHEARQHCVQRDRDTLPGRPRCGSPPGKATMYERFKPEVRQPVKETTGLRGIHRLQGKSRWYHRSRAIGLHTKHWNGKDKARRHYFCGKEMRFENHTRL
jgi:hypothetical protein